jgi:hypothetical protein
MLCLGLERKRNQVVHVILYNLVDIKTRSAQIHIRKALLVKPDIKMIIVIDRI